MSKAYYRDAVGALLVYDVCNKNSFEKMKTTWLTQIRNFADENIRIILGKLCIFLLNDKLHLNLVCSISNFHQLEIKSIKSLKILGREKFRLKRLQSLHCKKT